MRRTSRLLVLFGIGLAVLTFVLIIALLPNNQGSGGIVGGPTATPIQNVTVVTAVVDIPLSTVVTGDMLGSVTLPSNAVEPDSYRDASQVIGQIARTNILTGAQVTQSDFSLNPELQTVTVPPGKRAVAINVSDLTGVGRLIHIGDTVDVVVTFDANLLEVLTLQPGSNVAQHDDALVPLTVKAPVLLQDIQVIGTLEAPKAAPTTTNGQAEASPAPAASQGATTDASAQKLIILAVTDAQAEAILFARTGGTIDLVLRAPADEGTTADTDGVILKSMFEKYGVLPPYLIKTFQIYLPQQP